MADPATTAATVAAPEGGAAGTGAGTAGAASAGSGSVAATPPAPTPPPPLARPPATAARSRRAGRLRRHRFYRWVDRGEGLVFKQSYWHVYDATHRPGQTLPARPLPKPQDPPAPRARQPMGVYSGPFGRVQAKRLLDRAGFGAKRGEAVQLAKLGLRDAVRSLTRPSGGAVLHGPAPHDDDGNPLAPNDAWGHDGLWWLDRMVRSNQPLVERMALVFHDWFATSNEGVSKQQQMIDQSDLFRAGAFGSFKDLFTNVTKDPAMLQWLNGNENRRGEPNENYAREMMELFSLGADRGAYTEQDIREQARALTGWDNDWSDELGAYNFHFDPTRHDTGVKTVFGRSGNWDWQDAVRLCVEHPMHASFFVEKLWSYFVPTHPSASTRSALIALYTQNGYAIRPVVEAILMHPDLYLGAPMVKPPAVYLASLLRALGRYVDTDSWTWLTSQAGQMLFYPPNVSGWDDSRWLDTSRMRARWLIVTYALESRNFDPWDDANPYPSDEGAQAAMNKALGAWDWPPLRVEQHNELVRFSRNAYPASLADWERSPYRAMRENALRQLIAIGPDMQLM